MATYYLNSGAGGAATGADWTNAFLTYTAALAAATASGDIIKVHKTHTEELAADTTYTHQNHIRVICVDKDASDALATMGTAAWIGNSTTNRSVTMGGAFRVFLYGITLRTAGATADSLSLAQTDGAHFQYEACYLWHGNTGISQIQTGNSDAQAYVCLTNCTLRFGGTAPRLLVYSRLDIIGGLLSPDGSAPANLIVTNGADPAGGVVTALGWDISHLGSSNVLGDCSTAAFTVRLTQCKLGTFPPPIATQTNLNRSSGEIYAYDCATGDAHGLFSYQNPMGSIVSDTGIYFTSGAAAQSWKITTTANCSYYTPFETPWFGYYNTVTTSIAPYVEILRNGSATAYDDDEVWLDVSAKTTSGSTQATLYTSRMTLLGTPANNAAGAGLGSWTGESGTAWSGKMVMASLTPAEAGHIQARIVVGEPSITVYADPQIRT
jgi:hypothetical protein